MKLFEKIRSLFCKKQQNNTLKETTEKECKCEPCECNNCSCNNETLENIFKNSKTTIPNKYFMKDCKITNTKVSYSAIVKGFYFAPSKCTYFFSVLDDTNNKKLNWYLPKNINNLTLKFSDVYENDFFERSINEIYDDNGNIKIPF